MPSARLTPLLLGAVALLASACGASSAGTTSSSSLKSDLEALAKSAPSGDRAYWLGPEFHGAPVRFADDAWGHYAILTYGRLEDVDVDVESFRSHVIGPAKGYAVRVRTPTGQDVELVFHVPRHPDGALVRAAKAALQPIPARVSFPG
jgi:hypothetical protein